MRFPELGRHQCYYYTTDAWVVTYKGTIQYTTLRIKFRAFFAALTFLKQPNNKIALIPCNTGPLIITMLHHSAYHT